MVAGKRTSANCYWNEREAKIASQICRCPAEHTNQQALAVADCKLCRRDAGHVSRRAQQRRQCKTEREHHSAEKAEATSIENGPCVRGVHDTGKTPKHKHTADHERSGATLNPVRYCQQDE